MFGCFRLLSKNKQNLKTNSTRSTHVLTEQSDPERDRQPVDEDGEESLVVRVGDADRVGPILYAHVHGVVPAHVAGHDLVAVTPVLDVSKERVLVGVGRGFGCVCKTESLHSVWDSRTFQVFDIWSGPGLDHAAVLLLLLINLCRV